MDLLSAISLSIKEVPMKEFLKKKYNILIPIFLLIVILIAVLLYTHEYKTNRYVNLKEVEVYQYFASSKIEYTAIIGRNKKNVILSYSNKDFDVSLDSTPVYIQDKNAIILPKEMMIVFPLEDKIYKLGALSEIYEENNLYYLNIKNLNKPYDHAFLYDGKNTYLFIDEVNVTVDDLNITLSPMSYLTCSHLNLLEYYNKENDTYNQVEIKQGSVIVSNDYMKVDVSLDKVLYEKSFTLLPNDFSVLSKISDIEKE